MFVFTFAAAEMYINPDALAVYTPQFVTNIIPLVVFMPIFGALELTLSVWFLIGKRLFYPSVMASLLLIGIIVFNMNHISVLFRNVAIAAAALSLASMNLADIDFLLKKQDKADASDEATPVETSLLSQTPEDTAVETVAHIATPSSQTNT